MSYKPWPLRRRGAALLVLLAAATACGPDTPTPRPVAPTATLPPPTVAALVTAPPGAATSTIVPATTVPAATATAAIIPPTTAPSASGAITFQIFGEEPESAPFDQLVAAYGSAHPQVTVNLNLIPDQADYQTKLAAAFTAGNPPDVFLVPYERFGPLADKAVVEPIGPWLSRSPTLHATDFYTVPLAAFTTNGQLQCLPLTMSSTTIFYNQTLFAQYHVPLPSATWTWQDFLADAQALTKPGGIFGLGVEPQLDRLAPFIWQNGGDLVDNPDYPSKLTLETPAAHEAIQYFINLSTAYRVVPSEAELQGQDLEARWDDGKLAMLIGARSDTARFRASQGFTWDVAPPPGNKTRATALQSEAYCIAAASKNKAAAWDFIQFAAGPAGQTLLARAGRVVPTLPSVATSPAFLDPTQAPANSKMYLDILPAIRRLPASAAWPAVDAAVNAELDRGFHNELTVDQTITQMTQQGNRALTAGTK
ncbi:MAG TPA: sugar ABC transporter substrate-binding protein [Chloroflexia bacterium]|nr:sugar ABC transporter substrate-binding protein [Chloroflexia bacterium]